MSTPSYIQRFYTTEAEGPYQGITWTRRDAVVPNSDGSDRFRQPDVEAPDFWSERALRTAAQKYFVRPGVTPVLPEGETSVRQMIDGVAKTIRDAGVDQGVLDSGNADIFYDELRYLLIHQYGAFNSPVWFNCRRFHQYGIRGGKGSWAWMDVETTTPTTNDGVDRRGQIRRAECAYERPQCSACFLVPIEDNLLEEDGIAEHWKAEATIFKYGSGSGTNFSKLREKDAPLSNGGTSSGVMSWLKPSDSIAGTTKSGGGTRRAAKMVCLDVDHPEILDFIELKVKEDKKAKWLMQGGWGTNFEDESYLTVTGQNANNSVRLTDAFMQAVIKDEPFSLISRVSHKPVQTLPARVIWRKIAEAAWTCGDPGLHFDTQQQRWHTVPNVYGPITTTNPCSEFVHADNTACNLASLRLTAFISALSGFDVAGFVHATQIFITAMEILVDLSSYPTRKIARNSHDLRPLGLGYADLGTFLMLNGYAYDSDEGRAWAAAITSLECGVAYKTSARLAKKLGYFAGYRVNAKEMLGVIERHRNASLQLPYTQHDVMQRIVAAGQEAWRDALELGEEYGFRNSQTTLLAPTGTIAYLMDAETTGVEPCMALRIWKTMAGGGMVALPNRAVASALGELDYSLDQIREIEEYISEAEMGVEGAPHLDPTHYDVFDCALTTKKGTRYIAPLGHIRMMAAVQPFLSGAISKTVNLPEFATVEMMQDAYMEAWKLGLKAVALYRDGSKGVQVVKTSKDDAPKKEQLSIADILKMEMPDRIKALIQLGVLPVGHTTGGQRKLPKRRKAGYRQEMVINGHKLFVTPGEYEDGTPGEIFVDMSQEGSTLQGFVKAWAIAVSVGVQYGVPWSEYFKQFLGMNFEPAGMIQSHPTIKVASSVVSAVMKHIAVEYFGRTELQNVQPELPLKTQDEEAKKPVFTGSGPLCLCGFVMVRNGACYRCLNCADSSGCS